MVGGMDVDLDKMKTLPDANYWRMGAKWAREQMYNMVASGFLSQEKTDKIICRFWHNGNTWMYICLRSEHMLDLMKALVNVYEEN